MELQLIRLRRGRSALLSHLRERGVGTVPERQKIANTLARLSRAGRVPTKLECPAAPSQTHFLRCGKIAFLFLIYDCIYHEDLWHDFFSSANPGQYSVYVH